MSKKMPKLSSIYIQTTSLVWLGTKTEVKCLQDKWEQSQQFIDGMLKDSN
jgi:hypothetical protein